MFRNEKANDDIQADDDVRSNDTGDRTESDMGDEADNDYKVLQSTIVLVDDPKEVETNESENRDLDNNKNNNNIGWSSRSSFTADTPYFDAFLESEIGSLNILSETLGDIAQKTRAVVKAGAVLSYTTRRLALACKFRRDPADGGGDSWEESGVSEEEIAKQRRDAVGDEMADILELLGEVCACVCMEFVRKSFYCYWYWYYFYFSCGYSICSDLFSFDIFKTFIGLRRNRQRSTQHVQIAGGKSWDVTRSFCYFRSTNCNNFTTRVL